MLYTLILAALVQAVVLPSLLPHSVAPIKSLLERGFAVHNYALVCVYDRDATNFCQKHFGYGCDSTGKKRMTKFDHDCDVLCACIDLYPKSRCMVGLTGQSWCLRSVDHNEENEDIMDPEETASLTISARSIGPIMLETPQDAIQGAPMPHESQLSILQGPRLNQFAGTTNSLPRFRIQHPVDSYHQAAVCGWHHFVDSDYVVTRNPYDPVDSNVRDYAGHQVSANTDGCHRLRFQIQCSLTRSKTTACEQYGQVKEILNPRFYDILRRHPNLALRQKAKERSHHNYAMVCASDRQETEYCQNDGYYCDGQGKVGLRAPAVSNKYCNDNCKCIDVSTRIFYRIDGGGAMYLLSSDVWREVQFLDQSGGDLLTSNSTADSASQDLNRPVERDVVTQADLQRADVVTPLYQDDAAWWPSHNIPMVCGQDRQATNYCQSQHGYFCSASASLGRKAEYAADADCGRFCFCVDLHPKPNCIVNIIGVAQCA